ASELGRCARGREREIWRPDTGAIAPASFMAGGAQTIVPLALAPREQVFVVFPRPSSAPARTVPAAVRETVATIDGGWRVRFAPSLGAPPAAELEALQSWTEHAEPGVRYFSGTATYVRDVDVPPAWLRADARTLLDLGMVGDIAEVTVNGTALGLLWKPPYVVDVTDALRAGRNTLEIAVTNQWTNRIAGDRAVPEGERVLSGAPAGRGGGPPA